MFQPWYMYAKSLGKEATILGGVWGWFKHYPLCLVSACWPKSTVILEQCISLA